MKLSMSAQPHALDTLILGSIEEELKPCDRDSPKNKIKEFGTNMLCDIGYHKISFA